MSEWSKNLNPKHLFRQLSNNASELFDYTMTNIMDNFYDSAMKDTSDGMFKAVVLSGIRTEKNDGSGRYQVQIKS